MKAKIAVLVSGGGTNLQALIDWERAGKMPWGEIVLTAADRENAYALTRAERAGVETLLIDRRSLGADAFEAELERQLKKHGADVVVLAGFLSILSEKFVNGWQGRILNVHPSLIPAFSGKGFYGLKVHEAALERGVKVTGATVHLVTAGADAGPILAQKTVRVLKGDTPETLQRRVMEQAEWILLPREVNALCKRIVKGGKANVSRQDR